MDRVAVQYFGKRLLACLLAFAAVSFLTESLVHPGSAFAQQRGGKKSTRRSAKQAQPKQVADPCANFEYEQMAVHPEADKQTTRQMVLDVLRTGNLGANQQLFDQYYRGSLLPQMTHCNQLDNLPRLRRTIHSDISQASSPALRERIIDNVIAAGQQIAQGPYHPAARYNAMLLIGELSTQAAGGERPHPKALPALVGAISDREQSDVVRIAALIGLDRHARAGVPDNAKPQIASTLLTLLDREVEDDQRAEGQYWLQGQAADVLGSLQTTGPRNEVFAKLEEIVGDQELPVSVRARAAQAIGRLDYSASKQVNPSKLAAALGDLAVDAYNLEVDRAEQLGKAPNRAQMKTYFQAVNEGLVGASGATDKKNLLNLAQSAGDPHAKFVSTLVNDYIQPINSHTMFDEKTIPPAQWDSSLIELKRRTTQLETFLKANAPKPAARPAVAARAGAAAAAGQNAAAQNPAGQGREGQPAAAGAQRATSPGGPGAQSPPAAAPATTPPPPAAPSGAAIPAAASNR